MMSSEMIEMEEGAGEQQGDILDQVELMFYCEDRTRRQIGNKLKELGLIQNFNEITKKTIKYIISVTSLKREKTMLLT